MSIRQVVNTLRAWRDNIRQQHSRRRYDVTRPAIDRVERPERIVFVRWDAKWGDSVVFSFVCREFKQLNPTISIEVIATQEMAPLFLEEFGVDRVHETRRKPSKAAMRDLAQRIGEIDLVVHFSHLVKHRDMYLLSRLRTRHIAGLDDSVARIDLKLGHATQGLHFADKYVELLTRCGARKVDTRYIVPRAEQSERRAETLVLQRSRPFLCLNAYSKGRARSLTMETCERLARRVLAELPEHEICMLSAPEKQEEVEAFCRRFADERVFCLLQTQTIHDNISMIARSDGLISGITATVHLADGLDVPSFVLFPYDPADRDDWHSRHPGSINFLAEPSTPLDVNQLDWMSANTQLHHFCIGLDRRLPCTAAGSES
ncbi:MULTISPECIES: glycosyltransferase family 9 protein [Halomonadaceae]|uniref:glycosyltransferase family 9 protein n=1 Tax=Halomonadaceae TaxID=28256 RepID=UPI0015973D94|nr:MULTISPECIES: glycosyltransferase family 9 protein [Halomonas]QJQ96540.1 glycosyltransferase family 9 protein [Halomonas sp. PA5]